MAEKEFMMRLHGEFPHRLAIYILKDILTYKGVKFRDERQFKSLYHSPCEPDIFFEFTDVYRKGNKKQKIKGLYVVEVETNPTRESVSKKLQQYEEALAGVRLVIINLGEYVSKHWGGDDSQSVSTEYIFEDYREWLEERLPI